MRTLTPTLTPTLTLTVTLTLTLPPNQGNSCYMNSVLQLLAAMPEFGRYATVAPAICRSAPADPTQDALTQLAKVAEGLL